MCYAGCLKKYYNAVDGTFYDAIKFRKMTHGCQARNVSRAATNYAIALTKNPDRLSFQFSQNDTMKQRYPDMPPIISVVGKSKSGKTTLIEKLVPELKKRGYRIGTVKHAHHGFNMDEEGKDSWRHKAAGAETVVVVSPGRIAMVKDDDFQNFETLEKYFEEMDLVITEGFKRRNRPKIEICRAERDPEPVCRDDKNLIALVTDTEAVLDVPIFDLEDIEALADLIENRYL